MKQSLKPSNPGIIESLEACSMRRREFCKLLLSGAFFALFTKRADAEKKQSEKPLKEAMFWKRVD
jgi:hypothetical protein